MACVEARIGTLQLEEILYERYAQDEENESKHKFAYDECLSEAALGLAGGKGCALRF
jgi:hypothetical protein